jgi:hypothetical protein
MMNESKKQSKQTTLLHQATEVSGVLNKMAFLSTPIHNVETYQAYHPKTFF